MTSRQEDDSLFVYGALLDQNLRERLLGHRVKVSPAKLPGYKRVCGRYFYVRLCDAAETEGLILDGLDAIDLKILDRYEKVPILYTRERVDVIDADGNRQRCWIYLPAAKALDARS